LFKPEIDIFVSCHVSAREIMASTSDHFGLERIVKSVVDYETKLL